jgi:hypothetical protein
MPSGFESGTSGLLHDPNHSGPHEPESGGPGGEASWESGDPIWTISPFARSSAPTPDLMEGGRLYSFNSCRGLSSCHGVSCAEGMMRRRPERTLRRFLLAHMITQLSLALGRILTLDRALNPFIFRRPPDRRSKVAWQQPSASWSGWVRTIAPRSILQTRCGLMVLILRHHPRDVKPLGKWPSSHN